MPRRILITLIVLCVIPATATVAQQPRYLGLTLLTTNDLHANLVPFDNPPNLAGKVPQIKNVGGAARRATVVNETREETQDPVLLLDSGDTTFGVNPLAKAYRGAPDVVVMNAMGYEAMAPGNHEFEWHSQDTLRNLKSSRFPWVCANLADAKTGRLFLQPYVIREIQGVRVALLGLITTLVNNQRYVGARELGLRAIDPIETARKLVPEIRRQADLVIVLSHLGAGQDEKLAKSVPGIDVILGGHSHTRLPQPRMVVTGPRTAFSLGTVPVVQAFRWGSEMGRTRVIFRRDPMNCAYSLMSCKGELVSIDSSLREDPAISRIIRQYQPKPGE